MGQQELQQPEEIPFTEDTTNMFPLMSKDEIRKACLDQNGYFTPELNTNLHLHYKGYQRIENLEEYTGLNALWLDSNGLQKIENIAHLSKLRCLYLQKNLISNIENLDGLNQLVQLDLSENRLTSLNGLAVLPILANLNVSKNLLATAECIRELSNCKSLTSIDFSHNHFESDEDVIIALSKCEGLLSINMTGNPIATDLAHFRKKMIVNLKKLKYLDRPIFDMERATSVAWFEGGREAEQKVKAEWIEKKKMEEARGIQAFREWQNQVRIDVNNDLQLAENQGLSAEQIEAKKHEDDRKDERKKKAALEAAKEREIFRIEVEENVETEMKKNAENKAVFDDQMKASLKELVCTHDYDFEMVAQDMRLFDTSITEISLMEKDIEKDYQRGDLIVFRENEFVVDSSAKKLLIGIVERVDPVYTIVNRETVSCSFVLQILIIGKYKPSRDYIKHVDNSSDSSLLPFALKNYRRELLLDEIQKEKDTNESISVNEFKEKCNRVKAVDHIFTVSRILSDRSDYKINEEYKTAKIKIRQTHNIHSPGECRQKVFGALKSLETHNRNINRSTLLQALSKWHTQACILTSFLQNNAAVLIQKNVRRYVARRKYFRRRDRFFGYYVEGRSKDCHEIRPGVFISTQAKADEWFTLLQISSEVILKHLKIMAGTSTAIAVHKWKKSISLQQLEITKMREEEIFSFF